MTALSWDGRRLLVLDQTCLPHAEARIELTGAADTAAAIRRLAIRGAPRIGIAAGYGLAMELARDPGALDGAAELLRTARPTARNLAWAVDRVAAAARAVAPSERARAAREAAEAIEREDALAGAALERIGADWLQERLGAGPLRLLTHCNTGALAAGGRGTALGIIAELADRGPVHVLATEARPLLQGARLTVWELRRWGIPHSLLVDAAAAGLMRAGEVDAVVVGFDRVAANGDLANKVGTYGLALAAAASGIPFVAAGPSSSIDLSTPAGDAIAIEERSGDEVRSAGGAPLTVPGTACRNPAFDVTPAHLLSAIVTERGVACPADGDRVELLV